MNWREAMPDLPPGWTWSTIGEIATTQLGKMLSRKSKTGVDEQPYLRNQNVQWGRFELTGLATMAFDRQERAKFELRAGDLIVCEGGEVGRSAVWRGVTSGCFYQKALHRVRPLGGVLPEYLMYALWCMADFSYLDPYTSGSTIRHLPQEDLRILPVPIAPLDEQRRIVSELERRLSHIEAATSALGTARLKLLMAEQSLMSAMLSGALMGLEARTWKQTTIGAEFEVSVGSTPKRADPTLWNGPVPWVSSGEVQWCRIRKTRETISETAGLAMHPPGTVLIGMIGEGRTRGQAAILDIEAGHNQNCASIRVSKTEHLPEWVYLQLRARYQQTRQVGSGNNQQALNKSLVRAIPIVLPDPDDQRVLVEEAERRLSLIAATSRIVELSVRRTQRLRRSLIHKAFEGTLVGQDPLDEPAEHLLKRLQGTAATPVRRKPQRKRPRKQTETQE